MRSDVVASSALERGIQVFTNVGDGSYNPELVATDEPVSDFVTGDFDGDLQPDIAFRLGSQACAQRRSAEGEGQFVLTHWGNAFTSGTTWPGQGR